MSEDFSNKRALIYDSGLFSGIAWQLKKHFGEVLFFSPWTSSFPSMLDILPGHGYDGIKRVRDFWSVWQSVDLFIFPDCYNDDLQLHLESMNKRVWGSRRGVTLELDRWKTKQLLKKIGLPVQPCQQVNGLDNLRSLLKEKENCFIKLSRFRGDMESWHHINMELSEPRLDELAFRLGPFQNDVDFVVEDEIETQIEVGYDGVFTGDWPDLAMVGYEKKDCGLLAAVMPYDDLPEAVREVNEKLAPVLKSLDYRNFLSTEIRIGEDSLPYLIDVTCRLPSPSGEIQTANYRNLGEILWYGAEGQQVPIEVVGKFAAEAMIYSDWAAKHWQTVQIEADAQPFVTLFNSANISETGEAVIPSLSQMAVVSNEIGAVIGLGDTLQEAIDHLKRNAKGIKGMDIEIKTDSIESLIPQIVEAEKLGMKFSVEPLPVAG